MTDSRSSDSSRWAAPRPAARPVARRPRRPRPLTPSAARTLALVREAGPITSREVADRLGILHQTAHMRLARLEAAGQVRRQFVEPGSRTAYAWTATS